MANGNQYSKQGRPPNPYSPGYKGYGYEGYGGRGFNQGRQNPYRHITYGVPNVITPLMQYQQDVKNAKNKQNSESNDEINGWIKSMTDIMGNVNSSLAKVPPNMYASFQDQIRSEYNDITSIMRRIDGKDHDDPDRIQGLYDIEVMKNKWTNTNTQLESFLKTKVNFVEAKQTGAISDYYEENPDDKSLFSKIFTDNAMYDRDDAGNILFSVGYNKYLPNGSSEIIERQIGLNDLPDLIKKDFDYATSSLQTIQNLTKAKQPLSEINENLYRQKLYQELSNPRRLKSWLTDDFIIPGGFGIDESILNDPARFEELRDIAVDQTLELYKNAAQKGYDQEQTRLRKIKEGGGSTFPISIARFMANNQNRTDLTKEDWQMNVFAGSDWVLSESADGYVLWDKTLNKGAITTESSKSSAYLTANLIGAISIPNLHVKTLENFIKNVFNK
jgi:predicted translin family RNA/ssDNA-binding protein